MGQIGKFIDAVCESHPPLMRAVLDRPLAPLGAWLQWDEGGEPCGCLIGTAALAAGFVAQRGFTNYGGHPNYCRNQFEAIPFLADVVEIRCCCRRGPGR